MKLNVYNITGEQTGKTVELSEDVFGGTPNDHAIYLDVKQYLANQRQGTHKAKERAEINATTKKLKKQKGTGGARAGSMRSPLFVGGGRVFGPRPRNYGFKLNKKVKRLARRSALAYKAQESAICVLENLTFQTPKTKDYINLLNALSLNGKKTLLVLPEKNDNVYLSSRNLKGARVIVADDLNTYEVLHADTLILCEGSVEKINAALSK